MNIQSLEQQEILERISRHCPEAMSVYLHCINRADRSGSAFFSKEQVDVNMSEEWRRFRTNIKKLSRENLLEWHPFNNGISITLLVGLDEHE